MTQVAHIWFFGGELPLGDPHDVIEFEQFATTGEEAHTPVMVFWGDEAETIHIGSYPLANIVKIQFFDPAVPHDDAPVLNVPPVRTGGTHALTQVGLSPQGRA